MTHEGWVRVMKDNNDHRLVTVGAGLHNLLGNGINQRHKKRFLKSMKDIILPVTTVTRLVR